MSSSTLVIGFTSRIGACSATRMTYPVVSFSPRPNEHATRLPTPTASRNSSGTLYV